MRLLVTAGLVVLLVSRLDLGRAAELMVRASVPLIGATIVALLAANLAVAVRWHLILSRTAPSPGLRALLKIVLVGLFFNQVLPTGIGGDAVRAWRCNKLGVGLAAAIRSILLDRACGYLILVTVYAAALPRLLQLLPQPERLSVMLVFCLALAGLVGLVSIDFLPRAMLRYRVIEPLAELSRESRRLLKYPKLCAAVLGLSAVSIGLAIGSFELAGDALGCRLSFGIWAMIVPPVSLLQLVPISLAGWGVREAALVVVLGSFGVSAEAALAISVMTGLCLIVIGLPGGLIWLADWDIAQKRSAPSQFSPIGCEQQLDQRG